ncbi:MAG TPA: CBS domain-containing protein [Gemmatimonadaceae bacterium]|nr:CBS domain-containing protein [Gemmatimonadaceae bacterium]
MLRVREIMTPSVVSFSADQTLRDAVEVLVSCRIGGAPVLDGDKVVGVLSATDIIEFESVTPPPDAEAEPEPDEDVDEEELQEWQEGDALSSSYFTDWWPSEGPDVAERIASSKGPTWDLLSDHSVAEAMSRTVCTVEASMEVSNAAQRMLAAGAQRALVTDEGSLVGILTTTDILRAVAERRLTVRQYVFEK